MYYALQLDNKEGLAMPTLFDVECNIQYLGRTFVFYWHTKTVALHRLYLQKYI